MLYGLSFILKVNKSKMWVWGNETDISKLKQGVSFLIWRIVTIDVKVQDRNGIVNYKGLTSNTFL